VHARAAKADQVRASAGGAPQTVAVQAGPPDAGAAVEPGQELDEVRIDPDETGIAEAFVDLLRHEVIPPVPGFRVVRLVPPPEARGERPVDDEYSSSVVVGERVVVTWVREVLDADHEAPKTLAHLDAVEYFDVPETHGLLLWTAPSGREVPIAWATKYLPRARDGWDWCVDLAQRALGLEPAGADPWVGDFPARLGRTAAKLHLALATPSAVLGEPTCAAPPDLVLAWHTAARQAVDAAVGLAREGALEGVADVLLPRVDALTAAVDSLVAVSESVASGGPEVITQRIHGDLHVGQVLRWPGGLVVVDFHPCPAVEVNGLSVGASTQPAARDLARLLRSLDHVARVVDKGTGFTMTDAVDAWSRTARERLIDAYRAEIASAGRPELLDERLLTAFEAEQLCREIVYAGKHLPSWVYAPLGGLWQSFETTIDVDATATQSRPPARRRGRRARTL
jgi:maltokinase